MAPGLRAWDGYGTFLFRFFISEIREKDAIMKLTRWDAIMEKGAPLGLQPVGQVASGTFSPLFKFYKRNY